MAYEGWLEFGGVEMINLSRTTQLARALGISAVRTPQPVQWIQDELGGVGYADVTQAPWYDPGFPASAEFAGVIPLEVSGLDDSSLERSGIEYISDGGNSGRARNTRLSFVFNVVLAASTERGAEYGKRWLDRILRGDRSKMFCSGSDLTFFTSRGEPGRAYFRDVKLTRGANVIRRRQRNCSVLWTVGYTMTADDPFQYGYPVQVIQGLGSPTGIPGFGEGGFGLTGFGGSVIVEDGSIVLTETTCPAYDYSPIFDPLYPALVPPPPIPNFYPDGWDLVPGMTFERFWARIGPVSPTDLGLVPTLKLVTTTSARMVRVGIWEGDADPDDRCDPLFSAIVTYLPADLPLYIDGVQQAAYVWDGFSAAVRRADSLVYGPEASPVDWPWLSSTNGYLITLDLFSDSSGYEGDGDVRLDVSLTTKSD